MTGNSEFWPNGARLAVTVSMQFEAGGQPISGAPGPVADPISPGYPDLPQNSFYEYGVREGIPRMLDLFDRHDIKVTSFMIGEAVDKHPALAAEIVRRGHEAAAHGRRWESQYLLAPDEERAWISDSVASIERATGGRARGYNCYWMRDSVHTLELLQELGFTYHIDDLSADEPFIQEVAGAPFVTVPYTVHMNDIGSFDFAGFSPADYEQQLYDEFEQLYEEGRQRRRMMSISLHDRISGHASRVRVVDRFLNRARRRADVWWARRDEIADWALATPEITPTVDRAPAEQSGLLGISDSPLSSGQSLDATTWVAAEVVGKERDLHPQSRDMMHGVQRTGVRLVISNNADPERADEYAEWCNAYEAGITRPGFLANAFRFESPCAAGDGDDPRYAAIYDIVTPDPATAWPDTERSPDYPTYLFDDPRSSLVAPVLRGSYALAASLERPSHGALTGATIILADGPPDALRERRLAEALETGVFYAASRFAIVEGYPEPPDRLEILETDRKEPLGAYANLLELLALATSVRQRYSGSFRLHSAYPPIVAATPSAEH